jgi:YVTN family beta-propeller protein
MKNSEKVRLYLPINHNLTVTVFALAIISSAMTPARAQDSSGEPLVTTLPKNKVIATVPVGSAPQGIVVTPNTSFVYVANGGAISLSEIDTKTNTVALNVPLTNSPGALAITPDGSTLYIANYYASSVSVFDTATNTVTQELALSEGPSYLAMSPDGTQLYVLCNFEEGNGIIAIIDTQTNQVSSTTINVGGFPQSLVFTADGNHAYEVNDPTSAVTVIDTTTQSISGTLATSQLHAGGLALLPNGTKLFVTGDSTYIQVLNTTGTGKKKITLPEASGFNTPALTPNGLYLYLPIFIGGSTTVLMIDTKTNRVAGNPITVGTQPYAIAISSNAKRAYVSNYADGTVSVINIAP